MVIYPATVRARGEGRVFALLRDLRRIQFLPASEIQTRQRTRLATLLNYAYDRCPFYRAKWTHGDLVAGRDPLSALAGLPFVTKSDLQVSLQDLVARPGPRRVTRKVTGGSTGQPVTVLKDRRATAAEMAASWLGYGWFGVGIGDRMVRFWGEPSTWKRRVRFLAADLAMNRIRLSAFAFDDAALESYWNRCLAFQPDMIYGYVSMIEAFSRFLAARGYDGRRLGVKAVVTTAEALTLPQRELIRQTIHAPVQNEYGCGEVGPIAYECEQGSLHLMTENHVIEVITEKGTRAATGETGEIVVTDLNNVAMPLVRYRLGDMAVLGDHCGCGRGFPVLERIWGRAYDFVEDPVGHRYHGEFFMYLFEDLRQQGAAIQQFQVVQQGATDLEVRIVTGRPHLASEVERAVRAALADRLPAMRARICHAEALPRRPSGKSVVVENLWFKSKGDGSPASERRS